MVALSGGMFAHSRNQTIRQVIALHISTHSLPVAPPFDVLLTYLAMCVHVTVTSASCSVVTHLTTGKCTHELGVAFRMYVCRDWSEKPVSQSYVRRDSGFWHWTHRLLFFRSIFNLVR